MTESITDELLAHGISTGSEDDSDEGAPHEITDATLLWCDNFVAYVMGLVATTDDPQQTPPVADLITKARTDGVSSVHRYLVAMIQQNFQNKQDDYLGLGPLRAMVRRQLGAPFVQAFENTLSYAIKDLRLAISLTGEVESHYYLSANEAYTAVHNDKGVVLQLPSNTSLVDGLLTSLHHRTPDETMALVLIVCINGIALTIYDIETPVLPEAAIAPQEGMYRARATKADVFMTPDMPMDTIIWHVFADAAFLQGIISMDRMTKAVEPSCTDLQMCQNGQWVPARVINYDWQAPVTIQ